jgi:uncharacterized membrane protein SpoIIM required for sporulation
LVENIITTTTNEIKILFLVQILAFLCTVGFVVRHVLSDLKMYNLFFALLWLLIEGVVLVSAYQLKSP